ncbi:Rmf/CrpP fold protein [Nocardioides sp.]|uniref:Rmf/CrpP fold protein n=1 Tax=Nocardioides sp. TaxID=35761 RepID=UPI0037846250
MRLAPPVERRPALPVGRYGPRGLALRCVVDGREAGRAGDPVTVCPYRPSSRPWAARWWVRGYVAGRIEVGLPTAADRVDEWDEDAPWPGKVGET